jgi:hypothetical protein
MLRQNFSGKPNSLKRIALILKKVGISVVGFSALHGLSDLFFFKVMGLSHSNYSYSDQLAFPERICSSVNASVVSLGSIYSIFMKRDFNISNPNFIYYTYHDTILSTSCGYTIYDLIVMYHQKTDSPAMFIHHILALQGFIFLLLKKQTLFTTLLILVTELTVLPSNLLWYCGKLHEKKGVLYKTIAIIRMCFYWVFRMFVGYYCLYRGCIRKDYRNKHWSEVHWWARYFTLATVIMLTIFNSIWTFQSTARVINLFKNSKQQRSTSV